MEPDSEIEEETDEQTSERRRFERVDVEFPVRVQAPSRTDARAEELSPGGLRLVVEEDFTHAVHVSLRFELPDTDQAVSALADIRWHEKKGSRAEPRWVYGLQFAELDDEHSSAIESFVERNRTEIPPEERLAEESAVEA